MQRQATGEMATPPTPRGSSGSSIAAIVKAAISSLASVLHSWGKMPAVRTLLEYLGRKLPVWTWFGIAGVIVGGTVGTTLAVGALLGLFFDTGVAAWLQRRSVPAPPEPPPMDERPVGDAPRAVGAQEPPTEESQA